MDSSGSFNKPSRQASRAARRNGSEDHKNDHSRIQKHLASINGMPIVRVKKLENPYPPPEQWVAENSAIMERWSSFINTNPSADGRTQATRIRSIHLLETSRLKYIVDKGESVVFVDMDTDEIIAGVKQKLFNDEKLVQNLNGAVIDQCNKALTTSRKDDPGMLVQVGYTAGERGMRQLGWAKNLLPTVDKVEQANTISCFYAHVYRQCLKYLPEVVKNDIDAAIKKLDGLRMDGGKVGKGEKIIRYEIGGKKYESDILAPPCGFSGQNYARYVHNEQNLNKFCLAYVTARTKTPEFGGNFFLSDYGIMIPGRVDQMSWWIDGDWHGTSLRLVDPLEKSPEILQSGMAFIMSASLPDALEAFKTKPIKATHEQYVATFDKEFGSVELEKTQAIPKARTAMTLHTKKGPRNRKADLTPSQLSYTGNNWKKEDLILEIKTRVGDGQIIQFKKSWNKDELIAALIVNDQAQKSAVEDFAESAATQGKDVGVDDDEGDVTMGGT